MNALRRYWSPLLGLVSLACAQASPGSSIDSDQSAGGASGGSSSTSLPAGPSSAAAAGALLLNLGDASVGSTGGATMAPVDTGPYVLPSDYVKTEHGGYRLGAPLDGTALDSGTTESCSGQVRGIVRDFKRGDWPGGHPDFETFMGSGEKNLVEPTLDPDQKPVLTPGPHLLLTNAYNFNQWYRNTPGVNLAFIVDIMAEPNGSVHTFESESYFPLDNAGWGDQGFDHNFSFTTEIHTTFVYNGGETFAFSGDDDLWVFINGRLAIDLGGVHQSESEQISLDAQATTLDIAVGKVYTLDLFNAERHSTSSDFRMDTDLQFLDCGTLPVVK